jgi:hypothetical protein
VHRERGKQLTVTNAHAVRVGDVWSGRGVIVGGDW